MSIINMFLEFVSGNPGSAAQIFLTAVLALATVAYTAATFVQVSEMRTDRKARNRPLVKPTIENRYIHHFFAVENTGEGAAYDVHLEWWGDSDDKQTWKIPILSPGERRRFPLPFGDGEDRVTTSGQIEDVTGGDATIEFRGWYEDSLGNRYSPTETPDLTTATIDVLDTIEARSGASEYMDEKPIQTIADEMDDLTDQLEYIGDSIEMRHLDAHASGKIYERVLAEVREEGTITFRELRNRLGVDSSLLAELLHEMLNSGKVRYDEDYTGFFFKDALDAEIEYISDE